MAEANEEIASLKKELDTLNAHNTTLAKALKNMRVSARFFQRAFSLPPPPPLSLGLCLYAWTWQSRIHDMRHCRTHRQSKQTRQKWVRYGSR